MGAQDNAGKTTLLYRLKVRQDDKVNWDSNYVTDVKEPADRCSGSFQIGEVVTTIPTIGFNVESVTYKNLNFNVWVCFLHIVPCLLQHF